MNKLLKYTLYTLAFFIVPWVILFIGLTVANLVLGSNAQDLFNQIETVRRWDGLTFIGLAFYVALLFYWRSFIFWFAKNKVQTTWSDEAIQKLAKQTHIVVILIVSSYILTILWQ